MAASCASTSNQPSIKIEQNKVLISKNNMEISVIQN